MLANKNKIVHKKIKNTGILFELLTRQLTTDIINGKENSIAQKLIETHFKNTSALGKEYVLYQALLKYKFDSEDKAKDFISEVSHAYSQLNQSDLKKEKYNLIKEIKNNYDTSDFFKPKIAEYKVLASIYKIFKAKIDSVSVQPHEIVESKYTIMENIIKKPFVKSEAVTESMQEFEKQSKDLRLLSYKIMIDRFNEKYNGLDSSQKNLIKEYINNISQANSLHKYLISQIPIVETELSQLEKIIVDKSVVIKLNEIVNQVNALKSIRVLNDDHIIAMLNVYELIKELKSINK
jgi:hypothetical protein